MDKKQLALFKSAFKKANRGKISLTDEVDVDKIYDIEVYPDGMRNGCGVRFFIAKDEQQNYFLDLLGSDDYTTWHKRIDQDGNIIDLDNYKGQFGRPIYPDDPERTEREHKEIQDYNNGLYNALVQKGLERDFGNDDFEATNVIKIRN